MNIALGNRLREFRRLNSFTQKEFAKKVGVSTVFISKTERGLKMPSLHTLIKMAKVLRVSPNWLLCDSVVAATNPPEFLEHISEMTHKQRMQMIAMLKRMLVLLKMIDN